MKCVSSQVLPTYKTSLITDKTFGWKQLRRLGGSRTQSQRRILLCNSRRASFSQSVLPQINSESDKLGVLSTNKEATRHIRTLLIDNYDSYTYNIYQQLSTINGVPPKVIRNDEWTWELIYHYLYQERAFDNIVISPGPGSPDCPEDMGVCLQVLLECEDIPILGVCLGHQALGYVHGARIIHASIPVHGRLSEITHDGCSLFHGIPSGCNSGFKVVRYHSLVIDADSLPSELIPIAWTSSTNAFGFHDIQNHDIHGVSGSQNSLFVSQGTFTLNDGRFQHSRNIDSQKQTIMGVMHTSRAHYGVQFHPESVATCYGKQIFENFKKISLDHSQKIRGFRESKILNRVTCARNLKGLSPFYKFQDPAPVVGLDSYHSKNASCTDKRISFKHLKLQWKKFDSLAKKVGGSSKIFLEMFGQQKAKDTFWLDSSSTDSRKARFSFMGSKGGLLWKQYTFWLADKSKDNGKDGGYLSIEDSMGSVETKFLEEGFFSFLKKELQTVHYNKEEYEGLPFDFCGGYIGYLGYDLKIECDAQFNLHKSKTPDACFFFADNLAVVDHQNDDVYLLSLHCADQSEGSVINNEYSWLEKMGERLLLLKECGKAKNVKEEIRNQNRSFCKEQFKADKSRDHYLKDIKNCLQFIKDGECYELCLTTQMRKKVEGIDRLALYLNLREKNPAPYAAWFNFSKEDLSICCSSPERFLRLNRDEILEAKPIKGTIARGISSKEDERLKRQLQHSEKDQAENLMIVDLLRNDLGRVCEPGSVHVPRLMEVESYATVHTMVSTIRGKKRAESCPVDCVKAAFPGGSMTGAPKLRSMELLDSMENSSRGIYSGCIGYFSYNQRFDLNIVIRTVVIHRGEASIGAGGAITTLSKPEDEYEEMMLKAQTPIKAVMDNYS